MLEFGLEAIKERIDKPEARPEEHVCRRETAQCERHNEEVKREEPGGGGACL